MSLASLEAIDYDGWRARAVEISRESRVYVDGAYRNAEEGGTFESTNPTNGRTVATVARGTAVDIDAAVSAAHAGLRHRVLVEASSPRPGRGRVSLRGSRRGARS